jgi:hypothetical protein
MDELKCEGMWIYGGAFTLRPPRWVSCEEKPIVMLTIRQDSEVQTREFPACKTCWEEALRTKGIEVVTARPL